MNEKREKKVREKKFHSQKFYNFLKANNLIIFETIVGSQAYGTNTPESDIDKKFVYILPHEFILGMNYIEQININADYSGYEIKRFLELIKTNNPTLLELLNSPEDCIIHKDPIFDLILENKEKFITKLCKNSFGGYARQQILKAKGQDKMMNWEKDKVTRKTLIDFCNVIVNNGTMPLGKFLEEREMDQKLCGIVKVPSARDLFALYYDMTAHYCFSKYESDDNKEHNKRVFKEQGKKVGFGYKGIVKEDAEGNSISNELRLSSIPKKESEKVVCYFSYNKDGYISHCKDYKNYQGWLEKRNIQRWVDVEGHGQQIDGKNMGHCIRLIQMSNEIAEGKGIVVRRPNAKELLDIRKGKVDLKSIITLAEKGIADMDEKFNNSNLPKDVDREFVNRLLVKIRKKVYGLNDNAIEKMARSYNEIMYGENDENNDN